MLKLFCLAVTLFVGAMIMSVGRRHSCDTPRLWYLQENFVNGGRMNATKYATPLSGRRTLGEKPRTTRLALRWIQTSLWRLCHTSACCMHSEDRTTGRPTIMVGNWRHFCLMDSPVFKCCGGQPYGRASPVLSRSRIQAVNVGNDARDCTPSRTPKSVREK